MKLKEIYLGPDGDNDGPAYIYTNGHVDPAAFLEAVKTTCGMSGSGRYRQPRRGNWVSILELYSPQNTIEAIRSLW